MKHSGTDAREAVAVWLDGRLLPGAEARLPYDDRATLYGESVFETMRAREGRIFRLDAHLARLAHGAEALEISFDAASAREGIDTAVAASTLDDACVRLTLTGGNAQRPLVRRPGSGTMIVEARPIPARIHASAGRATVYAVYPIPRAPSPWYAHKLGSRVWSIFAQRWAASQRASEAIIQGPEGEVLEGAVSNVFVVTRDGEILAPPADGSILPGITRAAAIELSAAEGIPLRETRVPVTALATAAEVLLTNSLIGVTYAIPPGVTDRGPGRIARALSAAYDRAVKEAA